MTAPIRKASSVSGGMGATVKLRISTITVMGTHGGQRLPQLFPKDGFASSQTFLPLFLSFPRQSHHLSKIHTIYIDIIIIS